MSVQVPRQKMDSNLAKTSRVEEILGAGFDMKKFVENFEVLAEAPSGLDRLREFVLDVAIRGLLSDERQPDEPAATLLTRVRQEQLRAEKAREIDRVPRVDPIQPDELPHSLPPGWAWTRLVCGVMTIQIGPFGSLLHQSDYVNGGTPLVNPAHIKDGRVVPEPKKGVAPDTLGRLSGYRLRAGDVVMGRRGEMGKCAVITPIEDGWLCGTGSLFVRPTKDVVSEFLAIWLRSPLVRKRLEAESVGSTMNNLNLRILNNLVLALPPLAEQKRIVAKVDQLMALCDDLEARQTKKREVGTRLTKSALEALTTAEGPEEFDAAWKRVVENFEVLIDRAEKVRHLRSAVLELATRGILAPQVISEGSGTAQLQQLQAERNAIKPRSTGPDTLALADLPLAHPLPDSWCWASLEVMTHPVRVIRYGMLMPGPDQPEGPRYVKVRNMKNGVIDVASLPRTTPAMFAKFAAAALAKGDLLMSIRGSYGGVALVPDEIEGANITQDSARIAPLPGVDRRYLRFVLRSPLCQRFFASIAKGAAVQGINIGDIRRTPIPLPPLAEQQRIVSKIEHLMKVCDELEAALRRAEERASKLVDAAVHELVA